MVKELSPQYTGYFIADGTSISIQKEKYQLLLIADVESQDIPYAALCKTEDYESWKMVLKGLRDRIHCPARSVVIDKDLGLRRAVREVFPKIPIQLCVRHLHSYHIYHLKYQFQGSKKAFEPFLDITHRMLYARETKLLEHLFKEHNAMRPFFIKEGLEAEVLSFESKMGLCGHISSILSFQEPTTSLKEPSINLNIRSMIAMVLLILRQLGTA